MEVVRWKERVDQVELGGRRANASVGFGRVGRPSDDTVSAKAQGTLAGCHRSALCAVSPLQRQARMIAALLMSLRVFSRFILAGIGPRSRRSIRAWHQQRPQWVAYSAASQARQTSESTAGRVARAWGKHGGALNGGPTCASAHCARRGNGKAAG